MQKLLTYTLLICVFTLPLCAQTIETVEIVKLASELAKFERDITSIKSDIAVQSQQIEDLTTIISYLNKNQEKAIDRQYNLMIAFIAIPLAIIAVIVTWRSIRDQTMQKQIDALTRVIEAQREKSHTVAQLAENEENI